MKTLGQVLVANVALAYRFLASQSNRPQRHFRHRRTTVEVPDVERQRKDDVVMKSMVFNDAAGSSLRPQVMVSGYISNGAPGTMPPTHFRHMQLLSQKADSPLSLVYGSHPCLPQIFFFCCFPTDEGMLAHCCHLLVTLSVICGASSNDCIVE